MKTIIEKANKYLKEAIKEITQMPAEMVKTRSTAFTRKRKLPFEKTIRIILSMQSGTINKALLSKFHFSQQTPTNSAFVQSRAKIQINVFPMLLKKFLSKIDAKQLFKGYRLLATDGSEMLIPTNPNEAAYHVPATSKSSSYNLLHLNVIYDVLNRLFMDAEIQPLREMNEHKALIHMVDALPVENAIVTADRGYESYNAIAHLESKGYKYVFRVKSNNGICHGLRLPNSAEYDQTFSYQLTKKKTSVAKQRHDLYRILSNKTTFDYLDASHPYYPISFRVVRIKISDNIYETLITNLDRADFPPETLKHIYHLRWGVETAFRSAKYSIGMICFHSKKAAFIEQEIFAHLIMYNFSLMITSSVAIQKVKNDKRKLNYQINLDIAIYLCLNFFCNSQQTPSETESLIRSYLVPIRPNRSFPRKRKSTRAVSFNYRLN